MSELSGGLESFFAAETARPEVQVVVSERFRGEDGQALAWRLQPVTAEDMQRLWAAGNADGGSGLVLRLLARAVVYPDLQDAALQDSYGVLGAEELLLRMLSPGEYGVLLAAFEKQNLRPEMPELVRDAKN
ncbi:MAG: phage portal protein [Firmicutes bacterium]|nr:phage portal protein [Bacillota bacterium]